MPNLVWPVRDGKFEELILGCSNNERRAIERQLEKRLAAAMVAFDAAIHASRSARRVAEISYEAAARLAGRERADDERTIDWQEQRSTKRRH